MRSFFVSLFLLVVLLRADAAASEKQPSIYLTSPTGWQLFIAPHNVILAYDAGDGSSVIMHLPSQRFDYVELLAYFRPMYREAQAHPVVKGKHNPKKLYTLALAEADFIDEYSILETQKIRDLFEQAGQHPSEEEARRYAEARRKVPLLPAAK